MFGRPSIAKVLEDELYHSERRLIDARAKASHARQLARQHDAEVGCVQDHIQELRLELAKARAAAVEARE